MGNTIQLTLATACLAVLPLAGCDTAWDAYRKIELGKPLPGKHILRIHGKSEPESDVVFWSDRAALPFPLVGGSHSLQAVTSDGTVIAKYYGAHAYGPWLLTMSMAFRTVLECEVPRQAFQEADMAGALRASTQPAQPPANVRRPWEETTNVVSYLSALTKELHPRHLHYTTPPVLLFAAAMITGDRAPYAWEALRPERLSGITRRGFELTYRNTYGGTCRVQNLGDRRFRIECKYVFITDPFLLLAYLSAGGNPALEQFVIRPGVP